MGFSDVAQWLPVDETVASVCCRRSVAVLIPTREWQRLHKRGKKRLGEHDEAAIVSDREEGAGIARADYRAIISDGGGCDD